MHCLFVCFQFITINSLYMCNRYIYIYIYLFIYLFNLILGVQIYTLDREDRVS
jgi:hypothetical protein